MAESIFDDKKIVPDDDALAAALKGGKSLWDKLIVLSGGSGEWKFYKKAAGWTYPVKQGKRTLFHMMPKEGWLRLTFVYGERAVEAAKSAGLPEQVLNDLLQATAYAEGRSVNVDIRSEADIAIAQKLLQLKTEH